MKFSVLASGSKGNSTYVETKNRKYLIDLGTSCHYVEQKLKEINVNPKEIDAIFITHAHNDHIRGLEVFQKKHQVKVYMTELIHKDFYRCKIKCKLFEYLDKPIIENNLKIDFINLSHDLDDIKGYIIEEDDKSLVYITDTGYINVKLHPKLKNKTAYIIESNHDIEKLMNGRYPFYLQQRILSDRGHLSNKDTAYYLKKFIGDNTKHIVLAHLSEENNTKELALNTLIDTLGKNKYNIVIATQNEKTDVIEL